MSKSSNIWGQGIRSKSSFLYKMGKLNEGITTNYFKTIKRLNGK